MQQYCGQKFKCSGWWWTNKFRWPIIQKKNIAYTQYYIANAKNISQFLKKNLLAASWKPCYAWHIYCVVNFKQFKCYDPLRFCSDFVKISIYIFRQHAEIFRSISFVAFKVWAFKDRQVLSNFTEWWGKLKSAMFKL